MATSIADPAIVLSLLLNKGSVKQVEDQLVTGLRSAIDKMPLEFERIEKFLSNAIRKADIGSQLKLDLDRAARAMSQGNFSQPILDGLGRIEQRWRDIGNTAMASVTQQAQAIAKFGNLAGGVDVHPSWEESRVNSIKQKGYNAWRIAHIEEDFTARQNALTFTPHAASAGMRTIMVDPAKLDEAWKKQDTYIPAGGGGAEMAGKRNSFQEFLATRKAIESSKSFINKDGSVDFEDGRHRFSVLRDRGVSRVGMTVPEDQAEEFQRRFGTTNSIKNQRLVERIGDPESHFAGLNLGGRQQQIHPDQAKSEADAQTGVMSAYQRLQRSVERSTAQWDDEVRQRRQITGSINDRLFQGPRILSDEQKFARLSLGDRSQQSIPFDPIERARRDNIAFGQMLNDDRYGAGDAYSHRQEKTRNKKRQLSLENSHRFRFASQNIGFGIDDAIQSYHYGGIGASFRAASNNATAIAGMTISNPMTAAMTVVGLSVATAIAPVLLKRMGVDEESVAAKAYAKGSASGAETRYSAKGDISGSSKRGTFSGAQYKSIAEDALEATDQLRALSGMKQHAESILAKSFGPNLDTTDMWGTVHSRSLSEMTDTELTKKLPNAHSPERKEAEAALKMLREHGGRQSETQGRLDFAMEKIDWVKERSGFTQAESRRVSEFMADKKLSSATSVEDYESILKNRHSEEQKRIQAQTESTAEQKNIQLRANDFRLEEELSHKEEISRSTRINAANKENYFSNTMSGDVDAVSRIKLESKNTLLEYTRRRENEELTRPEFTMLTKRLDETTNLRLNSAQRDFSLSSFGEVNPLTSLRNSHTDRDLAISQGLKTFSDPDSISRLTQMRKANDEGLVSQMSRVTRDMKSEFLYGTTDPLRALTNRRDDRRESLNRAFEANPQDVKTFSVLEKANEAGFVKQRENLMDVLDNEFKVTSPLGKVADAFTSQAKRLEDMFEQNPDMTDDEKKRLTTNLEKSYNISMREANRPSGHERFTSDAMVVGGQHDQELQSRMLNNFVKSPDDSYKEQSLSEFKEQTKLLSKVEEKLEAARLGLP